MGRIGAHLSGIERTLLNRLAEANAAVTINSLRIATGQKVNAPSDDPSAFLALSRLQTRLGTVTTTMSNVTAAGSMITQVQTTLDQIRTQLDTIRTELVKDEDRDLNSEERAEAQANIDAAISQINDLAGTDIDGRRLLDGSADFVVSGASSTQVADLRVHRIPYGSSPTLSGTVHTTATRAELVYTGSGGNVTDNATFTLTGERGSASITVTSGEDLQDDVAQRINDQSHLTGVTAFAVDNELTLTSVEYGSGVEISVVVSSGTFSVTGGNGDGTANGTDATATINGTHTDYGSATVDGNRVTFNENGLHFDVEFLPGFTGDFNTITVSGDALTFALSSSLDHRSTLSIPGLHAARLGGASGTLDQVASGGDVSGLDGNTSRAIRIVDEALADLTRVEGSVDGFQTAAVTTASNLLADLEDDLENAITQTDGYDETEEALLLAKNQQLATNAVTGLSILNQQRANIVLLIRQIAGLT
ncbi:MAG TPA: flagellin hook IN motif-containing protein [Thermoguttaceae bacterium]|nr:flagellin hook IN motif-containing protein [Thermoguttaceae bacterium]